MGTADEYRKRAEAADEMAARMVDDVLRQGFLDLARQWRALADQIDGRNRERKSTGGHK
jgi:hypothetical protein